MSIRRRANRLLVAWTRVPEAARYEVVTTLATGEQRITRTRRASVTISRVARSSGGEVTVRAIDSLRQGRPASARFRATARRASTRVGRLPR